MDTLHIIPHERQNSDRFERVWQFRDQGILQRGKRNERVHKTLWCFYCKDDTTIRYTTDRLYVYNYYWTFSISNLLHCDESFQDEHYGNYGTWTSWTLAFSHVNPSQHATSDIFLPSKAFPFVSVNMTYGARTFLGDIDWRQLCCHSVAGELLDPVFLKCDPCYKLSAHSVSLTWNLPL